MSTSTLAAADTEDVERGVAPATPDGDNLILDHLRAEADAYAALASAVAGRTLDDPRRQVRAADLGVATPFGAVAHLGTPAPGGRPVAALDAVRSFFASGPGGPYLVFSPWPTEDLTDHGLARVGHPPLMFCPPRDTAPGIAGLRIRRVRDAEQLAHFERTLVEAYPTPEMQPWVAGALLRPAVLDTAWRLFVGYDGDEPVATSAAYVTPQLTMVELVSVRPEVRGRGYGAAITAAATITEPGRPAMLLSSDLGRPVYDRLGYLPLTRYSLWLGRR
jgi:hypothetical protein